jgi:diguanylate cyclase (GGDEF)-like protein/PAS domain S-box-containing protein
MLATAKPALVRALFAEFPIPVFVVEKDEGAHLRYLAASPAYASAMGIEVEDVLGRTPAELLPAEAAAIVERCCRTAFASAAASPCRVEEWLPLAAGRSLWRAKLRPLVDPATGAVPRVLGTPVELTDQEAEAAAGRGAEPSAVVDAVSDLIVRFGPHGSIHHCNEAYARSHGLPRSALIGTNLLDRLRPAERAIVRRRLAQVTPESPRVRYILPLFRDGGREYEEWVEHGVFDARGRLLEFQSVGRNATDRILAEERLRESEERYRALVDMSPEAICIVEDGRIAFANAVAARLIGAASLAAAVGLALADLVHAGERGRVSGWLGEVELSDELLAPVEWRLAALDGGSGVVESVASRIVWDGRPAIQICSRDVTERRAAQATVERLALYDHLTGLANRALFERELERACRRASRTGTSLALMFLDLDGFKAVNDSLGHAAGDELLRQLARRLLASLRETDVVARFGGDEFAVIATDHGGPTDFLQVVGRVEALFEEPFAVEDAPVRLGASVGVALYPGDARDAAHLLTRADAAMYLAKRAGPRHGHGAGCRATVVLAARLGTGEGASEPGGAPADPLEEGAPARLGRAVHPVVGQPEGAAAGMAEGADAPHDDPPPGVADDEPDPPPG